MSDARHRLFAYGSLLPGERDHELLHAAEAVADAATAPAYHLVDLGPFGAMVRGGSLSIVGVLYRVERETLARIDIRKEHPVLFQREEITLADGSTAETYVMSLEQVRGRRRLKTGDWRQRFAARKRPAGAWADWARNRR